MLLAEPCTFKNIWVEYMYAAPGESIGKFSSFLMSGNESRCILEVFGGIAGIEYNVAS